MKVKKYELKNRTLRAFGEAFNDDRVLINRNEKFESLTPEIQKELDCGTFRL
jgi:hypothetical protein